MILAIFIAIVAATTANAQPASRGILPVPLRTAAPTASPTLVPSVHFGPLQMRYLTAPRGFTATTDPQTCINHAGFGGYFVCKPIISEAGMLLLVWDWAPCTASNCIAHIDGFHIYRAAGSALTGKLVDTQPDASITMRAIQPFYRGECFVATAYSGKTESPASKAYCVGATAYLTPPYNVRYISTAVGCYDAFGAAHYQPCEAEVIGNRDLVLYWNWTPCAASAGCVQRPDGFSVYKKAGPFRMKGSPLGIRVAVQNDPSVLGADAGKMQAGNCYWVQAFHGQDTSENTPLFCVTVGMLPRPMPLPTATPVPMNVTIDITSDKFPANTIVAVGGTVTWKNDDNDIHDINGNWGWLSPIDTGSSTSYTFSSVGTYPYHCDYHAGMQGVISVVPR